MRRQHCISIHYIFYLEHYILYIDTNHDMSFCKSITGPVYLACIDLFFLLVMSGRRVVPYVLD